ncbi:MAG: glycosyl hydrolase, partial [Gammaproteobacteria bacterium]
GHAPAKVLAEARRRFRLARPALLETHRSNFVGSETDFEHSLAQLDTLLADALRDCPDLRFLSPRELARLYRDRPAEWCVHSRWIRLHLWLRRLAALPRLRKLAWLSGLALPAALLWWLSAAPARRAGIPA